MNKKKATFQCCSEQLAKDPNYIVNYETKLKIGRAKAAAGIRTHELDAYR